MSAVPVPPAAVPTPSSPVAQPAPPGTPSTTPSNAPVPVPLSVPARFQQFLAFDYGHKRTGVATGNRLLAAATPRKTLQAVGDARFALIQALVREWQPDALVVGVPWHPDGAAHENTARAKRFARQLHGRLGLPVYEVDERYSTTEALAGGAKDADAASACIILEQFLRQIS